MVRRALMIALAGSLLVACGLKPDAKSGGDAYRNEAKPLKLGKWITDSIARGEGDRTDWKVFDLGAPGKVTVELHADKPSAEIEVSVFNRYGRLLATTMRQAKRPIARIVINGKRAGRYFIMVREVHGVATPYTIRVSQGAGGGGIIRPEF